MTRSEFLLHDGEDEEKNDALHALLEGVDWEGNGAGITISLYAGPGDTITVVRYPDGRMLVGVGKAK